MIKLLVQVLIHSTLLYLFILDLRKTIKSNIRFNLKEYLLIFIIYLLSYGLFLYVANINNYDQYLNYLDYLNDYHITTFSAFIKHTIFNLVVSYSIAIIVFLLNNRIKPKIIVNRIKKKHSILLFILLFLCVLFISVYYYVSNNFPGLPFSQLVYHLFAEKTGAGSDVIKSIVTNCVVLPVVLTIIAYCFVVLLKDNFHINLKENELSLNNKRQLFMLLMLFVMTCYYLGDYVALFKYMRSAFEKTTIYEDYYVDPRNINYTFPENKRNLIYIYLESVEIGDYSIEHGGAFEKDLIEELYELAENNLTFNDNDGYYVLENCAWTVASMVGHSTGVPLQTQGVSGDIINQYSYMPGTYSIGEILSKDNYYNELLIGSDKTFGGRDSFYENHEYIIKDIEFLLDNKYTSTDTGNEWGAFDYQLYEAAKDELIRLSKNNKPFNLTMLTVDTHFPDGLVCPKCEHNFDNQYANVYACASKQLNEFISWIQTQDFYENTTIVIVGDHHTMDKSYFNMIDAKGVSKKGYYVFINSAIDCDNKSNRMLTTLDLFPTTLASLGIEWNNDRLGLGTNMFSDAESLIEIMGIDKMNEEFDKYSEFYNNYIMLGKLD